MIGEAYQAVDGYLPADLGLGCGPPTQHAGIKEGDVVLDLGSGAGDDGFFRNHTGTKSTGPGPRASAASFAVSRSSFPA
jgi:hypothetical protein